MTRHILKVDDYKNLAIERNGEYRSDIIPKNFKDETDAWYCKECDINVTTSYKNLKKAKQFSCHYKCKKKVIQDYKNRAIENGGEYILDYIPQHTGIAVKAWACKGKEDYKHDLYIWEACYNSLQNGRWCSKCANRIPKVLQDYIDLAKSIGWTYILDYIPPNVSTSIKGWRCPEGHILDMTFARLQGGDRCTHCYGNARKELSDYLIVGKDRDIKYVLNYIPENTDTAIRAWQCHLTHLYESTYGNIRDNKSVCPECPKSGKSKYEIKVEQLLSKIDDLKYVMEYKLINFNNRYDYRYDFYIEYKGTKQLLELDGHQHFEFVSKFHATDDYYQKRRNDDINKTKNAKDAGFKLTRLDYKYLDKVKDDNLLAFILSAFQHPKQFITSNDVMYKWVIDAVYPILKPKINIMSNSISNPTSNISLIPVSSSTSNSTPDIALIPVSNNTSNPITTIISKRILNIISK